MTIIELLEHVGVDNITVQMLDTDHTDLNIRGKNGTITFATDPQIVKEMALWNKPPTKIGFVVWCPRELMPKKETP